MLLLRWINPHHALFTHDSEGQTIVVDNEFIQTVLTISDENADVDTQRKNLSIYQDWLQIRVPDIEFVLDTIKAAKTERTLDNTWFLTDSSSDDLLQILDETDTNTIGLMGHSMGGAASVEVGRLRSDVSAVVDLDGTMLGEYLGIEKDEFVFNEEPYEKPLFVNWENYNVLEEYLSDGGRYPNDEVMKRAFIGYSMTIRDTKHMDFTDLPMLSPFLGNMLGSGERDTKEVMTIVNSRILNFYNCYLKGTGEFTAEDIY